jgi:hypothetical protein
LKAPAWIGQDRRPLFRLSREAPIHFLLPKIVPLPAASAGSMRASTPKALVFGNFLGWIEDIHLEVP